MLDNPYIVYSAFMLAAYLCGAIPFGFLIGKARGVDVRTVGSKNIGATNVYRTVGHKWGFLAFFCDFLKGLLPTLAAVGFLKSHADGSLAYLSLATGIMTVVGHMWTCFMKFRGGKGVATAFGMLMALLTVPVLAAFGVFVLTVWLSHYISLGSILAAAAIAVLVWVCPVSMIWVAPAALLPLRILVTLLGVFVIVKHRSNIARLAKGCENKIY